MPKTETASVIFECIEAYSHRPVEGVTVAGISFKTRGVTGADGKVTIDAPLGFQKASFTKADYRDVRYGFTVDGTDDFFTFTMHPQNPW